MLGVLRDFYVTLCHALIPGRMNLGIAWFIGFFTVPLALGGIAEVFAGGAADKFIFFGLIGVSALATPAAARWKGRRWWAWALGSIGTAGIMSAIIIPVVQPVTVLIVVLLAEPVRDDDQDEEPEPDQAPALPVPEGHLEPEGLRDLREQYAPAHQKEARRRTTRSRRRPRH